MSEGQMSEGQMSEGQMSEGQMSEGQMSEGQMSEGQMSEGQMYCTPLGSHLKVATTACLPRPHFQLLTTWERV
jgi:hypothetical protein